MMDIPSRVAAICKYLIGDMKSYSKMIEDQFNQAVAEAEAKSKKQLPDGMQHCTIILKHCSIGHSWLTASNWIQSDCPHCEIKKLQSELEKNIKHTEPVVLRNMLVEHSSTPLGHVEFVQKYLDTTYTWGVVKETSDEVKPWMSVQQANEVLNLAKSAYVAVKDILTLKKEYVPLIDKEVDAICVVSDLQRLIDEKQRWLKDA